MTNETDERRAQVAAQILFDDMYGGTSDPTLTESLAGICESQGRKVAEAIRASDEADGLGWRQDEKAQEAASLIEKQAAEIERLRETLTVIEGARYDGAVAWVLAGLWQKMANAMQATARAALSTSQTGSSDDQTG